MRKTAEQMAQELKARGFKVKLYYRKEGGARITSINGKAYTGSTGTKEARKLLGEALSEKQTKHLEKIRTKKGHFGHTKQAPIPKSMLDLQKKINAEFEKQGKSARVTRSKLRYRLKKKGLEETMDYLTHAYRYSQNTAFDEAVQAMIQQLEIDKATLSKYAKPKIQRVINALQKALDLGVPIPEKSEEYEDGRVKKHGLQDFKSLLYDWHSGAVTTKDFETKALQIISEWS